LARGMVLALVANEGTGGKVFDYSGYNGMKATLNGAAAWRPGNIGWAIDFSNSGSDFIKINPALGFGTSGTLVWSVVMDSIVTYGGHIIVKDSSAANCIFIYDTASSTVRVLHYNTANAIVIDINAAVSTNKWMTIAYTWSPVAGRLYINGVLKAEDTTIAGTLRIPSEIWIGSYAGLASRGLDGRISYVFGYNRVLSRDEIIRIHMQPFGMFEQARSGALYSVPLGEENVWLAGSAQAQSAAAAMLSIDLALAGEAQAQSAAAAMLSIDLALAGEAQAQSAAAAMLSIDLKLAGIAGATSAAGAELMVEKLEYQALYRGPSMEQIDFENVLVTADLDAVEIQTPVGLSHESSTQYYYVVRRFNHGYMEQTMGAAVRVSFDVDGKLIGPKPNSIFALILKQVNGNRIQFVWFYCPLGQETKPTCFRIYCDNGTGQIDYENPIADIKYKGRRYYNHKSGALEAGRYLFAVRAENADGTKHSSSAEARFDLSDSRPDSISILNAQAI